MARSAAKVIELSNPSNDSARMIAQAEPFVVRVTVEGVADLLFHRWSVEGVETKANAPKGSAIKKTDDIESYVYRNDDGLLCASGEWLRMATVNAAKYKRDPRSPRKSAMDLYKAGVVVLTSLAPLGPVPKKEWDYEHRGRVVVQRGSGVNRTRPAMKAGWQAAFDVMVNIPEYISPPELQDTIAWAGKLCGLGDFRPTYGRFQITRYEEL